MRAGVTMFATDRSMPIVDLAREVEARGFDSLWLPEHTHIPTSRVTPPPTGEAELPEEYRRTLDPLVALAAAATVTERLVVGTGVLLAAQRDPIVTAKALATLDHLAPGRISVGVGYGWNTDEMASHGVDPATRRRRTRDHVRTMQALWAEEVAEYHGPVVDLAPSWSWPKPAGGSLPVLLGGGAGPILFEHIVEYGHGWIPIGGTGLSTDIPRLRQLAAEAGRDPDELEIVPFGSIPNPAKLDHFARIGVTEVVMRVPSADRDTVLRELDRHLEVMNAWRDAG